MEGAHPRAGGENSAVGVSGRSGAGSSPRGRGKLVILTSSEQLKGLIPARAGKTLFDVSTGKQRRAHPRAGGENCAAWSFSLWMGGSSPRGRGKQHPQRERPGGHRLIPARAGKTKLLLEFPRLFRAHPRAGGENKGVEDAGGVLEGSSPRGRGKPLRLPTARSARGLIPARAGKTLRSRRLEKLAAAHPRAGGENSSSSLLSSSEAGSSPRGRGKRVAHVSPFLRRGLIPARAGKTRLPPPR